MVLPGEKVQCSGCVATRLQIHATLNRLERLTQPTATQMGPSPRRGGVGVAAALRSSMRNQIRKSVGENRWRLVLAKKEDTLLYSTSSPFFPLFFSFLKLSCRRANFFLFPAATTVERAAIRFRGHKAARFPARYPDRPSKTARAGDA